MPCVVKPPVIQLQYTTPAWCLKLSKLAHVDCASLKDNGRNLTVLIAGCGLLCKNREFIMLGTVVGVSLGSCGLWWYLKLFSLRVPEGLRFLVHRTGYPLHSYSVALHSPATSAKLYQFRSACGRVAKPWWAIPQEVAGRTAIVQRKLTGFCPPGYRLAGELYETTLIMFRQQKGTPKIVNMGRNLHCD